jgi:hypothetical protein
LAAPDWAGDGDAFSTHASLHEKEVRSILTPTQRIVTFAGIAGSLIAGGVIGANLAGPLAATAANSGNNGATYQLTAASASPSASAGTF